MADTPTNTTWWLPQAASSLNITRPLLNFRLRRVYSRMFTQVHFLGSYAREDDCPPWVCKQSVPVGMATIYTSRDVVGGLQR